MSVAGRLRSAALVVSLLILIGSSGFAARLNESFDGTFPPEGWRRFDLDSGYCTWTRDTIYPFSGYGCAQCLSEDSLERNDCWLLTPRLAVADSPVLRFEYRSFAGFADSLEVLISSAGIRPGDFADRALAVGLRDNNWHSARIDLSAYVGRLVYLALRSCGRRGAAIRVDQVLGPEVWQPARDFGVRAILHPVSYLSPGDTVQPNVRIRNCGTVSVGGVPIDCSVSDSATGQEAYHGIALAPTIPPGDTADIMMPTFWTTGMGTYRVSAWASLLGDENSINDTASAWTTASWTKEYAYDDGVPANRILWQAAGRRHGVRFTPAHYPALLASLRLGMHPDWYPNSPGGNTFRVIVLDDDGVAGSPGSLICSTGIVTGNRGAWNEVNMASQQIEVDSGSVYALIEQTNEHDQSPAWNLDFHDDAPESTQWVVDLGGGYATKRRSLVPISSGDFLIRATFTEIRRDVGATAILQLPDTVPGGDTITPQAVVRNFGDTRTGRFPVVFRIGTQYTSTVTAESLDPGATDTLTFADWTAERGHFAVSCSTALNGDIQPGNDVVRESLLVFFRDYGISRIVSPGGNIAPDSSISPEVIVRNFGSTSDLAPLILAICRDTERIYLDSALVRVAPGDSDRFIFRPWFSGSRGSYRLIVYTALAGDMNRGNDTAYRSFQVVDRDVGVTAIVEPADTLRPDSIVHPRVTVRNYGIAAETFRTWFEIREGGSTVRRESLELTLGPGEEVPAEFSSWPAAPGDFRVLSYTHLAGDRDPTNDTCTRDFTVAVRDAGIGAILTPAGMVPRDDSVHPTVAVRNFGTCVQSVPVHVVLQLDTTIYNESRQVQVAPGESSNAAFPAWHADRVGDYQARAFTALPVDLNRVNDTARASFHVYYRDAALVGILTPAESVGWDSSLVPVVQIRSLGSEPETIRVWFEIYDDSTLCYRDSADSALAPGDSAPVVFTAWAPEPGEFTAISRTGLTGDRNRSNDSIVINFRVSLIDAGATSILEPQGIVDTGETIIPTAVFCNFGTTGISGWSRFDIDPGGYQDSFPLNLAPGESLVVHFSAWRPDTVGDDTAFAFTQLEGDQRPTNDTVRSFFLVRHRLQHDVAVTQILEPRDSVRVDSSVAPRAVVWNFGLEADTFSLVFKVGFDSGMVAAPVDPVYVDTVEVQLTPGESIAVDRFAAWTARPVGEYLLSCRALLLGDRDSTNNESQARLRVFQPSVHDLGVTAILSPSGSIDTGTAVIPRAALHNCGNVSEGAVVRFRIPGTVYNQVTALNNLPPGGDTVLSFGSWTPGTTGNYVALCSLACLPDNNRVNDTLRVAFTVQLPSRWHRRSDLPAGPSRRRVRGGGALSVDDDGTIHALKGNRTREFYAYDSVSDRWAAVCSIPGTDSIRRGASLCYVPSRNVFYAATGGSRNGYLAYRPERDSWSRLADVPATVRPGACLAALDTGPVYLVRGGNSREFYGFYPTRNSWRSLAPVPAGMSGRGAQDGSAMIAVRDYLYLVKGCDNEFFAYSTAEDTWYNRSALPMFSRGGRRRRARAGTAIAHDDDVIYVLKGGRSSELWWYDTFGDTWDELEALPRGVSGRVVADGGALVWSAGRLWALKGNNTSEFWCYVPPVLKRTRTGAAGIQARAGASRLDYRLSVVPNPLARTATINYTLPAAEYITLTLHDVSGRTRRVLQTGKVAAGRHSRAMPEGLSTGIYFVELRSAASIVRCKVVKNR